MKKIFTGTQNLEGNLIENFKLPQNKNATEKEQLTINNNNISFWNEIENIQHSITSIGNIDITRNDLTNAINSNSLLPNYTYTITDYPDNGNNGAPQTIILTALTTSLLNRRAFYKTKVPDYQKTNPLNLGIWQTSLTPVVGNIVIDYGTHFVNLTETNGTQRPWSDATRWQAISDWNDPSYLDYICYCDYDFQYHDIMMVYDNSGNELTRWSYEYFPIGNTNHYNNKVSGDVSYVDIMNVTNYIYDNIINNSNINGSSGNYSLYNNNFGNNTDLYVEAGQTGFQVTECTFSNNGRLYAYGLNPGSAVNESTINNSTIQLQSTNSSNITKTIFIRSQVSLSGSNAKNISTSYIYSSYLTIDIDPAYTNINTIMVSNSSLYFYGTGQVDLAVSNLDNMNWNTNTTSLRRINNSRVDLGSKNTAFVGDLTNSDITPLESNYIAQINLDTSFSAGTLTLPAATELAGMIILSPNTSEKSITKIINLSPTFKQKFINQSAFPVNFIVKDSGLLQYEISSNYPSFALYSGTYFNNYIEFNPFSSYNFVNSQSEYKEINILPIGGGTYDITYKDRYIIHNTVNSWTLNLPSAVGFKGHIVHIACSFSGSIILAATGGQTINGNPSITIGNIDKAKVISNGANWFWIG